MTTYVSRYPPAYSATYVRATNYGTYYLPHYGTNPALQLDGWGNNVSWWTYSVSSSQKFNVDLGSATRIRRLAINNFVENGGYTEHGAKNCILYGTNSADAFANLTYSNVDNLTELRSFQLAAHIASNVADTQYIDIDNTVEFRYYVLRIADNWGGSAVGLRRIYYQEDIDWTPPAPEKIYAYLEQSYKIEFDVLASFLEQRYGIVSEVLFKKCEQPYSLLLEIWLTQLYGDVPNLLKNLSQPYKGGEALTLTKNLTQPWADSLQLEASLEQYWSSPAPIELSSEQRYGIAAAVLELTCHQLYDIHERTLLFADLSQPYAIAAEAAQLYYVDTKLYIDGVRTPYLSIEWEESEEYALSCEFRLHSLELARICQEGAAIRIDSAGESWNLLCYGGWKRDKSFGSEVYRASGYSRTRELDQINLLGNIPGGLASQIVADLAAPHGIAVDWQMADGFLADGKIVANDETAMEVIKRIVWDAKGTLISTLDGDLLVVAEVETPVPEMESVDPAATIQARLERISTSEQDDIQPGYNYFRVSDQLAAGGGFALEYQIVDATTREIRLFITPLACRSFVLETSGGEPVTIEPFGVTDLPVVDEMVEFVAGVGRAQRPVYGPSAMAWQRDNLGAITYSEDGTLTAAVVGESLLKISYFSRYHKWLGRDNNIETVQFKAREVLP